LQDVPQVPFGVQLEYSQAISDIVKKIPAALLSNDSVLVTGDKLL
jgi:L-fuculose-phosphate aldolase